MIVFHGLQTALNLSRDLKGNFNRMVSMMSADKSCSVILVWSRRRGVGVFTLFRVFHERNILCSSRVVFGVT